MRCASAAPLLALALALGACRSAAERSALEEARETIADLIAADNAGDLDAIASSYAEDAVLLPPGAGPVRGRAAIRERYAEGFARFDLRLVLEEHGAQAADGLAFSHGTTRGEYVWHDGAQPTPFADAYLMTLERAQDGRWRVAALMWSPVGE